MRFQPLNNIDLFQIISLVIFGLILFYLSFTDYKKLSVSLYDICLIGAYTTVNSILYFQRFGANYIFDGLKALILSIAFFLIIFILTRGNGIGIGDMIFFSLASINIGFKNTFEALLIAFSFGGIISLILIFTKKIDLKDRVPFIPFLSFGIYLSIFLDFFI